MREVCLESHYDIAFYEEGIEAVKENYRKKRMREALIGPFVSTIVHMAILISLFIYGTDNPINEVKDIVVNIYSQSEVMIEPLPVESPEPDDKLEMNAMEPDLVPDILENFNEIDFSLLDLVSDEEPSTFDRVVNDDFVSDVIISMSAIHDNISGGNEERSTDESKAFSSLGLYAQRKKNNRIAQTVKNGGTRLGQDALDRGLWWLASVQNPDGSWGKQDIRAMTGLAVLTFLAHGDTHLSKHFGTHMKKAFKWMMQDKVDRTHDRGYGHAIKTYALCEAYSMTALNDLEAPMIKCVEALIGGQQKNGAFDYKLKPESARQDTSVTGWCMQALKAAYVSGMEHKELPAAIELGLKWLSDQSASKGSFPYSVDKGQYNGGNRHSMRAIGALCLQLYGKGDQGSLQDELNKITAEDVNNINWDKPPARSLYAWYYATQSVFQVGGAAFRNWNSKMEPMLIANQHPKGYWIYPGDKHGSAGMDDLTGKIYSTTLCSLILTVYYRYLPTYKGLAIRRKAGEKKQEEFVNVVE